jgi:UPF0755 protein
MFLRVILAVLSIVVVVGVGVGAIGAYTLVRGGAPPGFAVDALDRAYGSAPSADGSTVRFVVQPGENAAEIGASLQSAGVIRSALAFRLIVRARGLAAHLVAGDYELRRDLPLDAIISALAQGRMSGGFLTIPEGWRALQISDSLSADGITPRSDFLQVVAQRSVTLAPSLGALPEGATLEGFLFPDSYRFAPNTPASIVAQRMVDDFDRHLAPDLVAGFRTNGLTVYQGVTLASIVEREAVVPSERPTIASVYLNRLRRGMKLEADPTVQYALVAPAASAPSVGYWKHPLTFADLGDTSPYNTYQRTGLPPGPICNPGVASLEAAAHPAQTDYLYFVARPDGTHAFAETFAQHQQNVAKYQG